MRTRYIAVTAVVLAALIFALPAWVMNAHGISARHLQSLRVGMEDQEVLEMVGRPSSIGPSAGGGEIWTYERITWCMIKLEISGDGTVVTWVHDH
jgi:hypothetical protein